MARCEPQTCQHRQGSKKASKRAERRFKSQSREWTWASQSTEDHSLHRNRNVHPSFSTRWLYIPLKVHSSSILPMPSEARPLHFLFLKNRTFHLPGLSLEICTRLPGTDTQQASRTMQRDSWSWSFNLPQVVSTQQQRKEKNAKVMHTRRPRLLCKGWLVSLLIPAYPLVFPLFPPHARGEDTPIPVPSSKRTVESVRKIKLHFKRSKATSSETCPKIHEVSEDRSQKGKGRYVPGPRGCK